MDSVQKYRQVVSSRQCFRELGITCQSLEIGNFYINIWVSSSSYKSGNLTMLGSNAKEAIASSALDGACPPTCRILG